MDQQNKKERKWDKVDQNTLETLILVREYCTRGVRISRIEYPYLMNHIRIAIAQLQNRKFGCISGRHAMRCKCVQADV